MSRVVLLVLCSLGFASPARPAIEILQPHAHVVIAGPRGVELPLQIRIEPHADNRSYLITWCGDGASGQTLDGEDSPALHPEVRLIIRVFPGACEITATVYGPGGSVRGRATHTLLVCGGDDDTDACGGKK